MNEMFNKPKGFGEILDHTFRLTKNRFADFMLIFLILLGPVYLLQAIIQLASGTSFFREVGTGNTWFEQMITSFEGSDPTLTNNFGAEIGVLLIGFISLFLFPVAQAAILFAVNHIRKNEEFTVGSVIKQGFSRFWPIIGSSILYSIIMIIMIFIPAVAIVLFGFFMFETNPIAGFIISFVLLLGAAVGVGYLLTRWSFYFGSVVLEKDSPGFSRSWRLTSGRTWVLIGLYIIFFLIISSISFTVELSFSALLGSSVLLGLIVSLVTLFTTLIMSVGYSVMYLDLKVRNDADDLKEMIDDYNAS